MENGKIYFHKGSTTYCIYLPKDALPRSIGNLLQDSWNKVNKFSIDKFGEFVTLVIRELKNGACLLDSNLILHIENIYDIYISYSNNITKVVYRHSLTNEIMSQPIIDGDLSSLIKHTDPLDQLRGHLGKIIRFYYDGGTRPGVRVVELEAVEGRGSTGSIKGTHCARQYDGDSGFRHYKASKIIGVVEILT